MAAKVAVVLSGCGVFDGSEIHEATSVLIHLSRAGARYECFAPDKDQSKVVDHLTGKPVAETRNVLREAARIARGKIHPLSALKAEDFDAVVFPGGFGAAVNLCDFAEKGPDCTVDRDVERVVNAFHSAAKPVGMCCIAPVIAARVLRGCRVTIGNDTGTAEAIARMGSQNVEKAVTEAYVDEDENVVTSPAYMYGAAPVHEVFDGIGEMVAGVLARCGAGVR